MENKPLKIRFRLPNGEEFEAEGPQEFIEAQRNYFLRLIGQQSHATPIQPATPPASAPKPADIAPVHTELYLWEQLLKEDEQTLILRRKAKLTAQEIAVLLIAGARVLLKKRTYSALELARSLKACGAEGRLDRLLASEMLAGRIVAEGSKRSRTYRLTDEGFARAFVLAEKLLKEYKNPKF